MCRTYVICVERMEDFISALSLSSALSHLIKIVVCLDEIIFSLSFSFHRFWRKTGFSKHLFCLSIFCPFNKERTDLLSFSLLKICEHLAGVLLALVLSPFFEQVVLVARELLQVHLYVLQVHLCVLLYHPNYWFPNLNYVYLLTHLPWTTFCFSSLFVLLLVFHLLKISVDISLNLHWIRKDTLSLLCLNVQLLVLQMHCKSL